MPLEVTKASVRSASGRFAELTLLLVLCGACFGQQFFPEGVFDEKKDVSESIADRYSGHLKALREVPLWNAAKQTKGTVYRFLWLHSFDHPVVVRLALNGDATGTLVVKVTSGGGGYKPGRLIENRTKKLSKQQTQWFLDRVEELKYWELPTREEQAANVVNLDGAHWIVEAIKDGEYKVVDRWPPANGPIKAIGIMMTIDLANMKLLYQDVY
jgi:hypothetical protein